MQRGTRRQLAFSVCLAALLLASGAWAEDKKPAAKSSDRSTIDESIHQNLRGIIDHGANLYNEGDWNGCYRLWEGTLMGLRPLVGDRPIRSWAKTIDTDAYGEALKALQSQLGDRPQLKDVIETGLTNARQTPQLYRRAFVLRVVLDQVRAATASATAKSKQPDEKEKPKTMWERLGGEAGVTKIVDDFVNMATNDPKVDFFRHNKVKLDAEHIVKMKREFVEQISQATGGPLKYTGPDMKKVHKDMGITNEQFAAAAADLKKALEQNKVAPEDVKKILDAVGSYRKEIVQPKKPEEKKSEEKKPAGKANVSGKVMYRGKPLPGGTIAFVSKDSKAEATIAADGSYKVEGITPEVYKLSVKGAKGFVVPAAFGDPDKSGLIYTAKEGGQTFDIELR